jgi:hypothetical protein
MKLTIEPTNELISFTPPDDIVACRVWHGIDVDNGIDVVVLVMAISPQTRDPDILREYDDELHGIELPRHDS